MTACRPAPSRAAASADANRTEKETTMPIERPLLNILACPIDKQGLLYFDDEAILYNPRLRRIYRMADDYLVMLADRAEPAAEENISGCSSGRGTAMRSAPPAWWPTRSDAD